MSQPGKPRTELSSWLEWKSLCALQLCAAPTQDQLAAFGVPILTNLFKEIDPDLNLVPGLWQPGSIGNQGSREKWQVFETYMHVSSKITGKRWKDWLFERAASSPDEITVVLEKLVCCCMRTAVRDFCTEEGRPWKRFQKHRFVSKDEPLIMGQEGGTTIEETLEDKYKLTPSAEAEFLELKELAQTLARSRFESMRLEARVAVLATVLDISLALPEIETAAKCKKTKLYKIVKQLEEEIRRELEKRFREDDPETLEALAQLVFQKIGDFCRDKLRSEKACSRLFSILEN